jgi:hypothetical protein
MTKVNLDNLKHGLNRPSLKCLKGWKNIIGVEIGVQYGVNARDILDKYDIKTLYLIDPYGLFPSASGGGLTGQESDKIKERAYDYLKNYNDKIIWVEEFSWDAVNLIPDNLDFIYIDGDHRAEAVEKDIELYYPKVRIGGLVAGHDYEKRRAPGVVNTIDNFFKDKKEVLRTGGKWDWWCRKV